MDINKKFDNARAELTQSATVDPLAFFQDTDTTVQELLDVHAKDRVVELLGWSIGECAWSVELAEGGDTVIVGHMEALAFPGKWCKGDSWIQLRIPLTAIIENAVLFAHAGREYGAGRGLGPLDDHERTHLDVLSRRLHQLADLVSTGLVDIDAATNYRPDQDRDFQEPTP